MAAVVGVGESAFAFNNQGRWIEIWTRARSRVAAIQLGTPPGRDAASVLSMRSDWPRSF